MSTEVANFPGLYGSLTLENLTWAKLTKRVDGKTVAFLSSTGCKSNERPYTVAFEAGDTATPLTTQTVKGSAKC